MRLIDKSIKVLFLLLLAFSVAARAYTPQFSENLFPLRWKSSIIKIAFSNSLLKQNVNIKADSDVLGAVQRSLESWERVSNIKFQTSWTDKQAASPAGNTGDGVSLITIGQTPENLLLFSGSDSEDVSARTRTFYNRRGIITESDIVLNPYQQFSTDGSIGTFDLEATLTHEIGHLLGLEHSFVLGATMHAHQGKNGVYSLANLSSRTLAEDDIAAVRALYGANIEEENCCGTINGKLFLANGKAAKSFQVWAEEAETGRIIAGVLTSVDGSFRFDGLRSGKFLIYSQRINEKPGNSFSVEALGEVEVKNEKPVNITKRLQLNLRSGDLQYVGFNGQISDLAVPLNGGKSYVVYIGGKNFDSSKLKITFSSPHISVTPNTLIKYEYDFDISVVSFELKISRAIPLGEYGVFVEDANGRTYCLTGGVTIESFENPWSSNLLIEND